MNDEELLRKVCIKYYVHSKTQNEIAKELFISRSKVSRILNRARENKIIEIKFNFPLVAQDIYGEQIKSKYNLNDVVVISKPETDSKIEYFFSFNAAETLDKFINDNMTIGCSWGSGIGDVIHSIKKRVTKNVEFVQLFGEISNDPDKRKQSVIVGELADKYYAKFTRLPAPLYIGDKASKKAITSIPIINDALVKLSKVDMIITSVGCIESTNNESIWNSFEQKEIITQAKKNDAIGYFCSYMINSKGEYLDIEYNKQNIAINKEAIKMAEVVLIESDPGKAEIIKALLEKRMINKLIISEEIAHKLYKNTSY